MQSQNRLLDDLARLAGGALGVASGMRGEVEARFREQLERLLAQMDLVTREDFEVVRALAIKAREEQESLAERVAALEAQLAGGATSAAPARPTKARAKSAQQPRRKPAAKAPETPTE